MQLIIYYIFTLCLNIIIECNSRIVCIRSHLHSFNLIIVLGAEGGVLATWNQEKSHDSVSEYNNVPELSFSRKLELLSIKTIFMLCIFSAQEKYCTMSWDKSIKINWDLKIMSLRQLLKLIA